MPFAIAWHEHKTVGPGCRAEDRRAAGGQRFDLAFLDADANVIDTPNGGSDLAGQWQSDTAVRQCHGSTTTQTDGRTGEQIVGTQARHRVARQQEDGTRL